MIELRCKNCNANLEPGRSYGVQVKCMYCGTVHLIENPYKKYGTQNSFRIWLKDTMKEYFSEDDIRMVCFNLHERTKSGSYDDIPGRSLSMKILELIEFGRRHGNLEIIIEIAMNQNREFALVVENYISELEKVRIR